MQTLFNQHPAACISILVLGSFTIGAIVSAISIFITLKKA